MGGFGSEKELNQAYFSFFFFKHPIRCGLSSRKVTHLVERIFLSKKSYCPRCATFLEALWEEKILTGGLGCGMALPPTQTTGLHHQPRIRLIE